MRRRFRFKHAVAIGLLAVPLWVYAKTGPLGEFYRGIRAMGMGNAFTAVSDNEDAVFYNPAGIAFNRRIRFVPLNLKLDASTDDLKMVGAIQSVAKNFDGASLAKIFGNNIYAGETIFPSLHFPYFVIGFYEGGDVHLVMRNLSLPRVDGRYVLDYGLVTGFGYESQGFTKKHFFRNGITIKYLIRQGFDSSIPISKIVTADKTFLTQFKAAPGLGIGFNFGSQYEIPVSRRTDLVLGGSWLDFGDTTFGGRIAEKKPPSIRNNLTAGAAFISYLGNNHTHSGSNIKLSVEGRHLSETEIDPALKMHFGMEIKIKALSVQAGWSQDGLTLGTEVDLPWLKVGAVTYSIENQALPFMNRERRYMVQTSIAFDLLDFDFNTKRDHYRKQHPRQY